MERTKIDISFHHKAIEEYIATYGWYYERGVHLGAAFETEIDRAIRLIYESPKRWPIYSKKFRRLLVRRFPYSLIYEIRESCSVVLAIAHVRSKAGILEKKGEGINLIMLTMLRTVN